MFLCATLFPLGGCNNNNSPKELKPLTLFDKHHGKTFTEPFSFTLEEFDHPTFNVSKANTVSQEGTSFKVEGANAVYIYDANGDGYRDVCVSKTIDNDTYLDYAYIYDLKNNKRIFYAIDSVQNAANDYHFRLKKEQLLLVKEKCDKAAYATDTLSQGYVKFNENKEVYIEWDNMYEFKSCDVSLSSIVNNDSTFNVKEENDVKVVSAKTNTLYCFEAKYETFNSKIRDDYNVEAHVLSLINRNNFDKNLKIFAQENDEGVQRTYFYFNDKVTADYELQMSGTSLKYKFVVDDGGSESLFTLIKAEAGSFKMNYEENETDYSDRYNCTRSINEDYKLDSLNSLPSTKVCEVKSNAIGSNKLHGRITYVFSSGYSPTFDIYRGGYFKYENKCYALLGDFDYTHTRLTHSDQLGFAVGCTELKIEDRLSTTPITFKDADVIRFNYVTYSHEDSLIYINFEYRYSFVIYETTFYVYDAKHVYEVYQPASGGQRAVLYTINSDYDFSSLFLEVR